MPAIISNDVTIGSTSNMPFLPDTARLPNGGSIVVWARLEGVVSVVEAQIFRADGSALGPVFRVNSDLNALSGGDVQVATLADGRALVTYTVFDGFNNTVKGQLVSAAGARIGGELQLTPTGGIREANAGLVALENGKFVSVWNIYDPVSNQTEVFARILNANGTSSGPVLS